MSRNVLATNFANSLRKATVLIFFVIIPEFSSSIFNQNVSPIDMFQAHTIVYTIINPTNRVLD